MTLHLVCCFTFGTPGDLEPGALNGAASLGASGEDASACESFDERFALPGRLGCLEPPAKTDRRRDNDELRLLVDEFPCPSVEFGIVNVRDVRHGRRVDHLSATSFECSGEFLGPALGGEDDAASGEILRHARSPSMLWLRAAICSSPSAPTTSPMTMTLGFPIPPSAQRAAMSASVALTTR